MKRTALLLIASLLAACSTEPTGVAPADGLHRVDETQKDNYYSGVSREFELAGVLPVEMTEEQFADAEVSKQLAEERIAAVGLYLLAYVTNKFEGIDSNDNGTIEPDEVFFHNDGYGDFSANVRSNSIELLTIDGDPTQGVEVRFEIDMAGPFGLLDAIARDQGKQVVDDTLEFDVRMPKGASIKVDEPPRGVFRRFDPDNTMEELETVTLFAEPHPHVGNAYPHYVEFMEDGLLDITMYFGHDYNTPRADESEARDLFNRLMLREGFEGPVDSFEELKADSGPLTKTISANGSDVLIEVHIFWGDMFIDDRQAGHDTATDRLVESDIFFYNGHAGPYYGFYLDAAHESDVKFTEFRDLPFDASKQQLFVAQGCQTYSIYADAVYDNPNRDESNLDVITTVNYSYGLGTEQLLMNLIKTNFEGEHQPVDYYSIISDLNSDYWNARKDVFYGVMGIDGNPQLHPYSDEAKLGQTCDRNSDCGDTGGNVCVGEANGTNAICGTYALEPDACPAGTEYSRLASYERVTSGACF